uniref:UPAR/Ly6 domain-containing protein n=1 Tax=Anopheles dirus TaxID=7168 RepID=A0A182NQW5_9DIPT
MRFLSALLLGLLLVAKTGYGLDCDFCYGEEDCSLGSEVPVVTCDEETVQQTNSSLVSFIRPLRTALPIVHGHYECVHVRAASVSGHVFLFTRGCVHRQEGGRHFCSLPHAAYQGSNECMACHGEDRCNNVPVPQATGGSSGSRVRSSLHSLAVCSLVAASLATLTTPYS